MVMGMVTVIRAITDMKVTTTATDPAMGMVSGIALDMEVAMGVAIKEIQEMADTLVDKATLVTLVVPEGIPEIPVDKTVRQAIPVTLPALMAVIRGDKWVDKAPLRDVPAQT
jgi:hypothetical protein